jgi:Arc/MetJ family transcription regulator
LDELAAEVARIAGTGRVYDVLLKWDTNRSGSIDAREMASVFKSLGLKASKADVKATMRSLDKDGDGTVSMRELHRAVTLKLSDSERAVGVHTRRKSVVLTEYPSGALPSMAVSPDHWHAVSPVSTKHQQGLAQSGPALSPELAKEVAPGTAFEEAAAQLRNRASKGSYRVEAAEVSILIEQFEPSCTETRTPRSPSALAFEWV